MKSLLFWVWLYPFLSFAQQSCISDQRSFEFNPNKIRTFFSPHGQKFFDQEYFGFHVPYPSFAHPYLKKTMVAGAPWIGGFRDGKLYIACQRFQSIFSYDFYAGPLNATGMKYTSICDQFDRVWTVFRDDILRHQSDFEENGIIDDTIKAVFGWPAEGNIFFTEFNGFELPLDHVGGWADFMDINLNGKYEPNLGEYPAVELEGKMTIPEQMIWMVYNDQGSHLSTNGRPLGVEIQFTAFGFYCENNQLLNHSLFNKYKITNQSTQRLDSLYFGQFHKYEIGCDRDDFIGCDTTLHTEFGYNADSLDGFDSFCNSGLGGYGPYLPIQSFTYLSHPLYSFINEDMLQASFLDIEFYRMLTGKWRNGAPMIAAGDGQGADSLHPVTRYLYHDDPRDPQGWSQLTSDDPNDFTTRTISSIHLNQLTPGQQVEIVGVYIYHQDSTKSHLEQFDVMHSNINEMTSIVTSLDDYCFPFSSCLNNDCVWPGDFNHDLFVDHRDLLYWGVANGNQGPQRNGLVNWRGHYSDNWAFTFSDGTNGKHQDADGNGSIEILDLQINRVNLGKTGPGAVRVDKYPQGDDLEIIAEPMDEQGDIGYIQVKSLRPLDNLYGITFEFEFDTFYFDYTELYQRFPLDSQGVCFIGDDVLPIYSFNPDDRKADIRYSFVGTASENFTIPENFTFLRIPFGLKQKLQVPVTHLPDQTVLRLKNLSGIDKEGNEVPLGANPYIVVNPFSTATSETHDQKVEVYPNPCRNEILVITDTFADVSIFSIQGQKLKVIPPEDLQRSIDVSDLSPGMYFLSTSQSERAIKFIKL